MNRNKRKGEQGVDKFRAQEKGAPRGPSAREAPCASATSCPPAAGAAVLSAMAGLASGFGMGPGDPRLHGRARGGRSAPARLSGRPGRARAPPWRSHSEHRTGGRRRMPVHAMRRARAISSARLSAVARACTCALSTSSSARALTEERTHLGGGFPLRCFQRLSVPDVARQPCRWSTTAAPEVRPPRSSRTRGRLSSILLRLRRIGTELSHDVLNPARVPL